MKRVFKYGTGDEIPKGAEYLKTIVQTKLIEHEGYKDAVDVSCWLVWHYFLVEDKPNEKP